MIISINLDQKPKKLLDWVQKFPMTVRWQDSYLLHDSPMDRKAVEVQNLEIKPQHREWFFHGLGIRSDMAEAEWQELI